MIILLPIGHEQLTLNRLPFATFALMAICIIATVIAAVAMPEGETDELRALQELRTYHKSHDYLELAPEIAANLAPRERELYELRQEWLAWLAESPEEAAAFVESTPVKKHRKELVPKLDATGQVIETRPKDEPPPEFDEKRLDSLKAEFLARAAAVDPDTRYEEQSHLDDLAERYVTATESSPARRFAYVPASPSPIGLVTHIFIHAGVIHLVLNLVFLWIVAAKLEDIWGRPLFVAAFVVFGVIGALCHGLLTSDGASSITGASGALAGLMGAYTVRLARSKVRFVYFYMILRPKVGSFDAPAFMIPLLYFFTELLLALFLDAGEIASWQYLGGIGAGVALGMAFKLTDFERRVLGREPEVEVDPDAVPLVAFQRPSAPDPTAAAGRSVELTRVVVDSIEQDRLLCTTAVGETIEVERDQVRALAAAQVTQLSGPLAERWLGATEPRSGPTVLLVLLIGGTAAPAPGPLEGYVIDAAELRYNRLFDSPRATPRDNFFALLNKVIALFPGARFAGDRERLAAGELPTYLDLDELQARLIKASI